MSVLLLSVYLKLPLSELRVAPDAPQQSRPADVAPKCSLVHAVNESGGRPHAEELGILEIR
jgi:hypothetical protein